jgi:phage-related baseplate assembly protein
MVDVIDLELLPDPEILTTLDFEAIFEAKKTRIAANFATYGIDYNVDGLETDPAIIIAEAQSYDELMLYARTNTVARSRLLYYATGGNLDQLVAGEVTRLAGETDARLKERYILSRLNRAEERYKFAAMSADVNVEDVAAYAVNGGPAVEVAILSAIDNGVPSASMLAAVSAAIENDSGRSINDVVTITSAIKTSVDLEANVWLLSDTDQSVIDELGAYVISAWNTLSVMGLDLVPSWVTAQLQRTGVQRVELVNFDSVLPAAENEAIAINSVTVNFMGRDY